MCEQGPLNSIWDKPQRPRWMDPATYAAIPNQLTVRQVCDRDWRITTTLTNSAAAKAVEIVSLYRQRWQIELDFRSIKCEMQMDILRCKTPQMVKKEVAAHLLGYNLIRVAITEAARSRLCLPRQLSFAAARRAVVTLQEKMRHDPDAIFAHTKAALLNNIGYWRIPHRPNRFEPRAVKRRQQIHPLLTVPRHIARQQIAEQRQSA